MLEIHTFPWSRGTGSISKPRRRKALDKSQPSKRNTRARFANAGKAELPPSVSRRLYRAFIVRNNATFKQKNEEFGEVSAPSFYSDFTVSNIVDTFGQIKPPCDRILSLRQASKEGWATDTVYHLDSTAPNLPPSPRTQGNLMQGLRSS
jgi:hypothetical protein